MANPYKLVIVESPAKAKTIGKMLGRGYKVEASNGHIRDLPKSKIGVDVERDFEPYYITIRGRGEILERIRKEAKHASKVYLATDPDREGEAISWHLANILNIEPSTACRVEFHEITKKAIQNAIKQVRPIDMDLVDAQQARRVLDRLVGYKISPLLWNRVKKGLSAGRVQSVATLMICEREQMISEFVPEEYWTVHADLISEKVKFEGRLSALDGVKVKITNEKDARAAEARIRKADFSVKSVKRSERKRYPSAPFTTSNMQQEAGRKLGFTTQKTMQIAQQLYEGVDIKGIGTVGLVTYIRTDSVRINDDALGALREHITGTFGDEYLPEKPYVYKNARGKVQDAHEAIRPTDVARRPEDIKASLTNDQFKLYRLIYNRFVASQMASAVYDVLSCEIEGDGVLLLAGGQKLKFDGFMHVYVEGKDDDTEEKDDKLPDIRQGTKADVKDINSAQHFTQPPPRFTEASLVRALEEKGIGRPSTYAPTISTIIARGYVVREKKILYPTELGNIVNDLMKQYFPEIVNIEFTADLEEKLDHVEEGNDWKGVIRDFYTPFARTLEQAEATMEKIKVEDQVSDVACDKCGAMMVYKMGRYGKFLACPNFPECRNTKPILVEIDAPCPKCGAKLLERPSRKGRKFYGCEKYPDCDFVSWDMPVKDKCPQCGSYMVKKYGKGREAYTMCSNAECRYKEKQESKA